MLASYAAERGYDALVYDYRGMGASAPAGLAEETCRMSDWGLFDMRTALAEAAARARRTSAGDTWATASAGNFSDC